MSKSLNILIVSSGSFSGVTESLTKALSGTGANVQQKVVSLRVHGPFIVFYMLAMSIEALFQYGRKWWRMKHKTVAGFYAYSASVEKLISKTRNIDVVLQIGLNGCNIIRRKNDGIAYVVFTDHVNILSKKLPNIGYDAPERHTGRICNYLEKKALSAQDYIFVTANYIKRSIVEDYGIPVQKVVTVGIGPNNDVDIERDEIDKNHKSKDILFVGANATRKGLDVLIDAFHLVKQAFPERFLHIVGVDGDSGNGVKYYGRCGEEQITDLYYKASIFAMPTYREPFGIVYIEAMLAKCVCIGTSVGATPEIIQDGQTGYLVEPGDSSTLAERIIHLFNKPDLIKAMGEKAYIHAKETWGWSHVAEIILEKITLAYEHTPVIQAKPDVGIPFPSDPDRPQDEAHALNRGEDHLDPEEERSRRLRA